MRIAVLSDTHLRTPDSRLIKANDDYLQNVQAVLHCGDITTYTVWAYLNSHPAFYAVCGNMDHGAWSRELPELRKVELQGLRIGLTHGHAADLRSLDLEKYFGQDTDLICFGHTHYRHWSVSASGINLLNPGSFSLPKADSPGFALLELNNNNRLHLEWVNLTLN